MDLKLKNISKSYGGKKVLDDFSLTLSSGVYGLLGPNGAGKSTLIGIIAGLITPDCGAVVFSDDRKRLLKDTLGFLPQYQGFYKNFTAEEFMFYMTELKNYRIADRKKYVYELLESVNLADSGKKKIRTFSGGMKQRLGIAQALIGDPEVIIFDEPTAGLDPKERIRFRNVISSLGRDKIIILATHIVTDVAYIAKEVVLIDKGRLIYAEPQNKLTEHINGKVWYVKCGSGEVIDIMNNFRVSNVSAEDDSFCVRIISNEKPFDNAVQTPPNLDDVCLYCFGEI